jgi:hypothetical protein
MMHEPGLYDNWEEAKFKREFGKLCKSVEWIEQHLSKEKERPEKEEEVGIRSEPRCFRCHEPIHLGHARSTISDEFGVVHWACWVKLLRDQRDDLLLEIKKLKEE